MLEGFRLYPDEAKLPQKLKDILHERRDVLSETDKLIEETAHILVNGRFLSLDEVRATIDKIALDYGLERKEFHYMDKRLATAFEQLKARQYNAKSPVEYFYPPKGTPGSKKFEFDGESTTELYQCSMKEFKSDSDVAKWLENKAAQIDATVGTAKIIGRESGYLFRWQPRNDVVEALKAKGIKNVRWDLPPR